MKRFMVGADRGQSTLLPECLDDWIDESNPVRVLESWHAVRFPIYEVVAARCAVEPVVFRAR